MVLKEKSLITSQAQNIIGFYLLTYSERSERSFD